MSITTPDDRRSLALPDWRTALKKKVKRPRRPSPLEIIWFITTIAFIAGAVMNLIDSNLNYGIQDTVFSGIAWKLYLSARKSGVQVSTNPQYRYWYKLYMAWLIFSAVRYLFGW